MITARRTVVQHVVPSTSVVSALNNHGTSVLRPPFLSDLRRYFTRQSTCCATSSSSPLLSARRLSPYSRRSRQQLGCVRFSGTSASATINGAADLLNQLSNISIDTSEASLHAVTVIAAKGDLDDAITALPTLARVNPADGETVYVLLFTPSFAAKLREGNDRIARALDRLVGSTGSGPLRVQTLVAVVDKLPALLPKSASGAAPDTGRSQTLDYGVEGLCVTYSSARSLSAGTGDVHNWSPESSRFTHSLEPEKPATLTFVLEPRHDEALRQALDRGTGSTQPVLRTYEVQLSLPSTIFHNGLKNTLIKGEYSREGPGESFVNVSRQVVQHAKVALPLSLETVAAPSAKLDIPLYRMTEEAVVDSCMGNIIRTVRSDAAAAGTTHASKSLELAVSEYFKHTGKQPHALSVWALVVPQSLRASANSLGLSDAIEPKSKFWEWPNAPFMGISDLQPLTDLISRGAKFCRVTAGGGGWGNKAGLLSLDPDTSYEAPIPSFIETVLGDTGENDPSAGPSGLAEIASSGDSIQFYFLPPETLLQENAASPATATLTTNHMTLQLGVIPDSTDVSNVDGDEIPSRLRPQGTSVIYDQFGALSEKGLSLSTKELSLVSGRLVSVRNQTKIDMPFARFTALSIPRGDSDTNTVVEAVEGKTIAGLQLRPSAPTRSSQASTLRENDTAKAAEVFEDDDHISTRSTDVAIESSGLVIRKHFRSTVNPPVRKHIMSPLHYAKVNRMRRAIRTEDAKSDTVLAPHIRRTSDPTPRNFRSVSKRPQPLVPDDVFFETLETTSTEGRSITETRQVQGARVNVAQVQDRNVPRQADFASYQDFLSALADPEDMTENTKKT